jgi:hypothetical protein
MSATTPLTVTTKPFRTQPGTRSLMSSGPVPSMVSVVRSARG